MKRSLTLLLLVSSYSCAITSEEATRPAVGEAPEPAVPDDARSEDRGPASDRGGRYATPPAGVATARGFEERRELAPPTEAQPRPRPPPAAKSQAPDDGSWGPSMKDSAPAAAPESAAPAPAPAAPSAGVGGMAAESRSAEAMDEPAPVLRSGDKAGKAFSGRARSIPAPEPEVRPGLGTSWGETRYSSVSEVAFERDSYRPSYTASLHYDNERGAAALAGSGLAATTARVGLGAALTLILQSDDGRTLPAYYGHGHTVAIGADGQHYSIVVHNNTNERFEVVLSVDGLDVLDGRDAAYAKRGYLIDAYGTIEIEGFRQSDSAVAAFRFGTVADSYAARTGKAKNVGVIGAAAFGERGYSARLRAYQERLAAERTTFREVVRRQNADPFPNRYATEPLYLVR
ncbi:MAG: hypothetical protein HY903_21170 [Deltaproteobacteria bacterium]|nr:hypothetical protein [Deltaproteobacteria bacterium]